MTEENKFIERVDLHIHSNYSDGLASIEDIFRVAKKAKFKGIAITDHDTTEHWDEVEKLGKERKVPYVLGTEFSAMYDGGEVHILGYNFDRKNATISEILSDYKNSNVRWVINLALNFASKTGKFIDFYDFDFKGSPDKVRITKYLVEKGILSLEEEKDFSKLVQKTFKQGGKYHCKRKIKRRKVSDIIEAIHDAGGIAVLAHPMKEKLTEKDIKSFVNFGLDGIEVFCRGIQEKDVIDMYYNIAIKHKLLITGGSDFHGNGKLGTALPNETYDYFF